MRTFLGVMLMIAGLILGVYVGVWKCFILGIVGVIDAIRTPNTITSMQLAISIAKVLCAGFFGWCAGMIVMIPGWFLVVMDR